jgi:hypothetical protein
MDEEPEARAAPGARRTSAAAAAETRDVRVLFIGATST